jgi:hypothetical protein
LERFGLRTAAASKRRLEYAKEITRLVADRFGVPVPQLAMRFTTLEGHAGRVQFRNGVWYVDIDEKYRWDDSGLTAIVAHEFAHVAHGSRGIRFEPQLRNEYLTDAVAALAGFAPILHEVCERQHTEYFVFFARTVTSRLGYLSRGELKALIGIQRRLSRDRSKRRLLEVTVGTETAIECLCCGSQVTLPVVDGRIRLRCSWCGLREDLRIRHGYVQPPDVTPGS